MYDFKTKSPIVEHFSDIPTLQNSIYRSNAEFSSPQILSCSKKKLSFVFSHNSHRLWKWSTTKVKIKLISSSERIKCSSFFETNFISFFLSILSLKRYISIRMEWKKIFQSFTTSRLNTTFRLTVLLWCTLWWREQSWI